MEMHYFLSASVHHLEVCKLTQWHAKTNLKSFQPFFIERTDCWRVERSALQVVLLLNVHMDCCSICYLCENQPVFKILILSFITTLLAPIYVSALLVTYSIWKLFKDTSIWGETRLITNKTFFDKCSFKSCHASSWVNGCGGSNCPER